MGASQPPLPMSSICCPPYYGQCAFTVPPSPSFKGVTPLQWICPSVGAPLYSGYVLQWVPPPLQWVSPSTVGMSFCGCPPPLYSGCPYLQWVCPTVGAPFYSGYVLQWISLVSPLVGDQCVFTITLYSVYALQWVSSCYGYMSFSGHLFTVPLYSGYVYSGQLCPSVGVSSLSPFTVGIYVVS